MTDEKCETTGTPDVRDDEPKTYRSNDRKACTESQCNYPREKPKTNMFRESVQSHVQQTLTEREVTTVFTRQRQRPNKFSETKVIFTREKVFDKTFDGGIEDEVETGEHRLVKIEHFTTDRHYPRRAFLAAEFKWSSESPDTIECNATNITRNPDDSVAASQHTTVAAQPLGRSFDPSAVVAMLSGDLAGSDVMRQITLYLPEEFGLQDV